MCSLWQGLSIGTIDFERVTLTVTFDLLLKNLNIAPMNLHMSCGALPDFVSILVDLVTLTLKFDFTFAKLNHGHNFLTRSDRTFILHMCIPRDKTFSHGTIIFEPKAPVTYCDHALSGVRCPSVRRPLDNLHFQLLPQNHFMDFDETWYWWSTQGPLQVLLFFGQICPGADTGRGKNRSQGVPFFKELFRQIRRLQQQTECIAVI